MLRQKEINMTTVNAQRHTYSEVIRSRSEREREKKKMNDLISHNRRKEMQCCIGKECLVTHELQKCFMIRSPCSLSMQETPWKKPRNFGLAERWSLMNLTLTVSIGVTANMASVTPAPRPHRSRLPGDRLPFSSTLCFFNCSKAPNLE